MPSISSGKTLQHRRNHVRVTDLRVFRRFCSSGSQNNSSSNFSNSPTTTKNQLVRHSGTTTTEASSRAVSADNRLGRQLNENYTLRLRTERRVVFCCCTARPVLFFLSMYAVCYSHPLYNLPAIRRMNSTLSDGREWAGTNESIFTENGHIHTGTWVGWYEN